ncbi:MAG: FAD-dependent oxidoreductase [Chloroflexi bacterium]|nr:FAD-dependent oxidoreductase [Chloroflexota bacterium]
MNAASVWNKTVDFLVVGSGGGGMTAALMAKEAGMDVLVIEKTSFFGGSTARSGGAIWVPNNYLLAQDGIEDSLEQARLYMRHTVGDRSPQSLQDAYLVHAPQMVAWLRDHTCVRFQRVPGYADYYPERPGGLVAGRTLEPVPFDGRKLGPELARLRKPMAEAPAGLAFTAADYRQIGMFMSTWEGKKRALRVGLRWLKHRLSGVRELTMGQALSARLRYAMMQADIPLWLDAALQELIIEEDRVVGARVEREARPLRIRAGRGVLLAAGGFPHNLAMRQQYLPKPTSTDWSVASPGNTGDAIRAGMKAGAAVDLMEEAWWGPSSKPPDEAPFFHVAERAYPGALMVNGLGRRFVNESAPYIDVVHAMYANHSPETPHIPAWFIFDQRYRNKYIFGLFFPMQPIPKRHLENGYIVKADNLKALARLMGVDAANLVETVSRFNEFARAGVDQDFRRGESAYDRYYGDPTVKPNPNLAPLTRPPYYAVRMWPGDLGTKGGLVTDEWARVLRKDGTPIPGLYATGNSMASVMGASYPGAGATIGPAMTFGYLAARHAAGS